MDVQELVLVDVRVLSRGPDWDDPLPGPKDVLVQVLDDLREVRLVGPAVVHDERHPHLFLLGSILNKLRDTCR